ncbi:glycosyltransferase [Vibrio sp. WJH972]
MPINMKTKMKLAPICLFVYNRLHETKETINALSHNAGALESELFIFSDAAKNEKAKEAVNSVRQYIRNIKGFKNVTVIERTENFGLAKSIICGVSNIVEQYDKVIVLEDDLITSKNFLAYMNQALSFYQASPKVWSISGFSFPIKYQDSYQFDNAFGLRASSWGWATWKDRWDLVDWDVSDYQQFSKDRKARKAFNRGGSDMCKMLHDQRIGKINSWAIRFCYAQFKQQAYDVLPVESKILNIGFSVDASHTAGMEARFSSNLDQSGKTNFVFDPSIAVDENVLKQFRKPLSLYTRVMTKITRLLKL